MEIWTGEGTPSPPTEVFEMESLHDLPSPKEKDNESKSYKKKSSIPSLVATGVIKCESNLNLFFDSSTKNPEIYRTIGYIPSNLFKRLFSSLHLKNPVVTRKKKIEEGIVAGTLLLQKTVSFLNFIEDFKTKKGANPKLMTKWFSVYGFLSFTEIEDDLSKFPKNIHKKIFMQYCARPKDMDKEEFLRDVELSRGDISYKNLLRIVLDGERNLLCVGNNVKFTPRYAKTSYKKLNLAFYEMMLRRGIKAFWLVLTYRAEDREDLENILRYDTPNQNRFRSSIRYWIDKIHNSEIDYIQGREFTERGALHINLIIFAKTKGNFLLEKKEIDRLWKKASVGMGRNCWIEQVQQGEKAQRYLAKYLGKGGLNYVGYALMSEICPRLRLLTFSRKLSELLRRKPPPLERFYFVGCTTRARLGGLIAETGSRELRFKYLDAEEQHDNFIVDKRRYGWEAEYIIAGIDHHYHIIHYYLPRVRKREKMRKLQIKLYEIPTEYRNVLNKMAYGVMEARTGVDAGEV